MINIQQVFQKFFPEFNKVYTPNLMQQKAARDILNCKTSALGGNSYECEECGHIKIQYNSCRNRHCPMCQGINKSIWIDKRTKDIIDAPYFHVVFTIPLELQSLVYQNQKLLYTLMYKAVAETLQELSSDKKYLSAQTGFFSILHTWGQNLHYHPHIHTVILAGGLTKLNTWRSGSKKFFIPVKVLSKKFRGKFLYYLKKYYSENLLKFYGDMKQYETPNYFQHLLDLCYLKDWYTFSQRTFSSPLAVIKYLGNYTHRIAISNSRIISMDDDTVTFTVKSYKDNSKKKTLTLKGVEFIRRFLMHILPKGFVKIRYYGILANRNKKTKLSLCRKLTNSPIYKPRFEGLTTTEILCILIGKDITLCPECKKGKLRESKILLKMGFP